MTAPLRTLFAVLLLAAPACLRAADSPPWFTRMRVGLEVGPTGSQFGGDPADVGYASRFDGREIARATKTCGGENLVIWARDGDWAYYDSKLQPKCPGLGSRDVLREAVEEGHKLGLPIIAYCVQQYPGQTLKEHPDWRIVGSDRFEKEMTDHIRRVNSRATIDFNYHGNPPFSWEVGQLPVRHAQNGDFVTGETGVWGFSALTVGLNVEFYRAATPGKPVQVAMQRGVRMYHDQTTRPLNDIRWELFNLLAHGAFVTIVDKTGFDGWLDPVAYERFGAAFREVHAKRGHFGQKPVQDVGIYYSSRTRDWIGREKPANFLQSFQGAHKTMVYEHISWGVIHEENVSLDTLRRFSVVLLPNVSILSDHEFALLRQYVEAGGKLLLTGLSGTHDRMGNLQTQSSLETSCAVRRWSMNPRRLPPSEN
jgi:hypothetical protein